MLKQKSNEYFNLITSDIRDELYDSLLYHYNSVMYGYGNHHKSNKNTIKSVFRKLLNRIFGFRFLLTKRKGKERKIILSNAYVKLQLPENTFLLPPWSASFKKNIFSNWRVQCIILKLNEMLEEKNARSILSHRFVELINEYNLEFGILLKNNDIKCVIVPNDMSFFENLTVKIANHHKIPSFVYLHGLPARYNMIDDNRAKYLIVWGKGLKDSYINAGFDANKILVLKHPIYSNLNKFPLRSDLSNVLVISKAMPGAPISSIENVLINRSRSLYYVESVKNILVKLGVKSARLRLHPSESELFYENNLIGDFYQIDRQAKDTSIGLASLVIGPTSTMLLDTIKCGVNYILFDPLIEGKTLDYENSLVKPFDGSSFVKLSQDFSDFSINIRKPEKNIDQKLLNEYLEVPKEDYDKFLSIIS